MDVVRPPQTSSAQNGSGTSGFWLSGLVSQSGVVCVGVSSWASPHLFQHLATAKRGIMLPRIPVELSPSLETMRVVPRLTEILLAAVSGHRGCMNREFQEPLAEYTRWTGRKRSNPLASASFSPGFATNLGL